MANWSTWNHLETLHKGLFLLGWPGVGCCVRLTHLGRITSGSSIPSARSPELIRIEKSTPPLSEAGKQVSVRGVGFFLSAPGCSCDMLGSEASSSAAMNCDL